MVAYKREKMEIESTIVEPTEEEIQDEMNAFLATSESINSLNNLFYNSNSEGTAEE